MAPQSHAGSEISLGPALGMFLGNDLFVDRNQRVLSCSSHIAGVSLGMPLGDRVHKVLEGSLEVGFKGNTSNTHVVGPTRSNP